RGLRTKRAMRFRAQAGLSVGEPISLESFLVPGKNERRIMEEVTTVTRDRVGELLAQLQQEMGGFNSI
ncbi:MAG: hypothetical protein WCP58_10400, partial [bacterium]